MAGRSSPSTTETRIDPRLVPFVEQGLGGARSLFETGQIPGAFTPSYFPGQTFVGPSAYTQQAIEATAQRAQAGSPLVAAAQQGVQQLASGQGPMADTAAGQMLGYNPFLQGTFESVARPLTQQFQGHGAHQLCGLELPGAVLPGR